jgi:predicted ester cyclase
VTLNEMLEKYVHLLDTGELGRLGEVLGDDFHDHGAPPGLETYRERTREQAAAFIGAKTEILSVAVAGDRIFARCATLMVHAGEAFGIAPTGRQVVLPFMMELRADGGKFVEGWIVRDLYGLVKQLRKVNG